MTRESVKDESETSVVDGTDSNLVVLNDDHNTFDWVIHTFVDILGHNFFQAEQCAYIIHKKGKCSVKQGSFEELQPYKTAISERGLRVVIE